jgi:integrase/recombinase XerC
MLGGELIEQLVLPLKRAGAVTPAAVGASLPTQVAWHRTLLACDLLPPDSVVRWAAAMTDPTIAETYAVVAASWQRQATQGDLSQQTADRFALIAGRFVRFTSARAVVLLRDVDAEAVEFVHALGRDRRGTVQEPAAGTMHLRRAVLRAFFRTARTLGLFDRDPTLDLVLPPRGQGRHRPLTDDELALCKDVARLHLDTTREPAVLALALASAGSGEIGAVAVGDVDLVRRRVWLPGTSRSEARWGQLDEWAVHALERRIAKLAALTPDVHQLPHQAIAYEGRDVVGASRQASACVALKTILTHAGLSNEPDLRPASASTHGARKVFETTGRLEDAARVLGVRSLDRAARAIAHNWQDDALGAGDVIP